MYYFILTLAVLCIVGTFLVGKIYQKKTPATFFWALTKNIVLSMVTALIYWMMFGAGRNVEYTPLSLWCAFAMSVALMLSAVASFFGYCLGNIGIFTVFQMAGGMLIPYVYGAIMGNHISIWNVLGLGLILCGLSLSVFVQIREIRQSQSKVSPKFLALCWTIFILNGCISTISYYYCNHSSVPAIEPFLIARPLFGVIITLPLALSAFLWEKRKVPGHRTADAVEDIHADRSHCVRPLGVILGLLIVIALIDAAAYFLQITATPHLPAVAIYPFVTGGTIALTALAGRIFFGEKMDRLSGIGTVLIALATLLFLF